MHMVLVLLRDAEGSLIYSWVQQEDDEKNLELSQKENHIKQINAVYDKVPIDEQTFDWGTDKEFGRREW